ncbi:MAG: outer membrane lipoprotein-sorting protein [Myxococcaceae bacterium]
MTFALLALLLSAGADAPPADLPKCPSDSDAPDVAALMKRTERVLEGGSSIAVMTMSIKTPSYQRAIKMKIWSKGRDFAVVRVLAGGPRETGMMTLKRENQLWNYLPQAGRVMKLPSGMMGDSWMGSDFTNDDLVKGSSIATDFTSVVDKTVLHQGRKAWFVTLTPKASAKVVWGKVEMLLDRATCVPLEQRFFDEDNVLARRMTYSDLKQVGWRTFPMKLSVFPAEKGRETSMSYETVELDVDVPDDTFSLRRLQQGKD